MIGKVTTDPRYVPDSQMVEVGLKINKDVQIHDDAKYVIGSSGLLGDRFVIVQPAETKPGEDKRPFVKDGDKITGTQEVGIGTIMNASKPLIDRANDIATQLDDMITRLNKDVLSGTSTEDLKETIAKLRHMVDNGDSMVTNANDLLDQAKHGQGILSRLINDKKTADDFSALIANLKAHGPIFYHDDSADKSSKSTSTSDNSDGRRKKRQMSEPLSAWWWWRPGEVNAWAFDKLLTPLGGQPLLVHTLERPSRHTGAARGRPRRPARHSPGHGCGSSHRCGRRGNIRLVDGGALAAGLGLRRAQGGQRRFRFRHGPRTPRGPFVTKEMIDLVLAAARLSDAAVCGAPCSDSLKNVGEGRTRRADGRPLATLVGADPANFSAPSSCATPIPPRSRLARRSPTTRPSSRRWAIPCASFLYHGVNLKVTTPSDWQLAEALLRSGEGDNSPGQVLRKQMHDNE